MNRDRIAIVANWILNINADLKYVHALVCKGNIIMPMRFKLFPHFRYAYMQNNKIEQKSIVRFIVRLKRTEFKCYYVI